MAESTLSRAALRTPPRTPHCPPRSWQTTWGAPRLRWCRTSAARSVPLLDRRRGGRSAGRGRAVRFSHLWRGARGAQVTGTCLFVDNGLHVMGQPGAI